MFHTPAHKQTNPAALPAQIVKGEVVPERNIFFIEFTWGGARCARARTFLAARQEVEQAARATGTQATLLADSYKVIGRTDGNGILQLKA